MFKLARTFLDPKGSQTGFADIGAAQQQTGDISFVSMPRAVLPENPVRPTKGLFSWLYPGNPRDGQAGQPEPENALQHRPPGSMPQVPPIFGEVAQVWTPEYSRGAAAYVPNTGTLFTNPIGAGIVAMQRPQGSYGPSGQYVDHTIFWATQVVPTSVHLSGLATPDEILALLGQMNVQAALRVY